MSIDIEYELYFYFYIEYLYVTDSSLKLTIPSYTNLFDLMSVVCNFVSVKSDSLILIK